MMLTVHNRVCAVIGSKTVPPIEITLTRKNLPPFQRGYSYRKEIFRIKVLEKALGDLFEKTDK